MLLFWGLLTGLIYIFYYIETPQGFAAMAETPDNAIGYANYVDNIPDWAIATGVFAAIARIFGALSLLIRRSCALAFYIFSLTAFTITMFRAFILADVVSVMNGAHVAIEIAFFTIGLFAVWFAHEMISKRILK